MKPLRQLGTVKDPELARDGIGLLSAYLLKDIASHLGHFLLIVLLGVYNEYSMHMSIYRLCYWYIDKLLQLLRHGRSLSVRTYLLQSTDLPLPSKGS